VRRTEKLSKNQIGNGVWGIKWPRDRSRHVTQGHGRDPIDPNVLRANISKPAGDGAMFQRTTNRKWHMANRIVT